MSESQKRAKIGSAHFAGRIFDHCWDCTDEIVTLGELSAETVGADWWSDRSRCAGHHQQVIGSGVYDSVIVFGATVPHEVAGFAGGAKYFPGVAGPELTHTTHWLGALAGIENTIGQVETPARKLIEAASNSCRRESSR